MRYCRLKSLKYTNGHAKAKDICACTQQEHDIECNTCSFYEEAEKIHAVAKKIAKTKQEAANTVNQKNLKPVVQIGGR